MLITHRNALEDPWQEPDETMFTRSVSPEQAPDIPTYVEVNFQQGDPVGINGQLLSPATLLTALNTVRERLSRQASALSAVYSVELSYPSSSSSSSQ